MSSEAPKVNLFTQAAPPITMTPVQRVIPASVEGNPTESGGAVSGASFKGSKLFAGGTEGINTKIGIGDTSSIPAMAGKQPGIGRTLAFA